MHAITDRQQRIWENLYAIAFYERLCGGKGAKDAHIAAVEVADNAVGRLIVDALPVEQMANDRVDRFRP